MYSKSTVRVYSKCTRRKIKSGIVALKMRHRSHKMRHHSQKMRHRSHKMRHRSHKMRHRSPNLSTYSVLYIILLRLRVYSMCECNVEMSAFFTMIVMSKCRRFLTKKVMSKCRRFLISFKPIKKVLFLEKKFMLKTLLMRKNFLF